MAYSLAWEHLMEYPESCQPKEDREQYFFYRKEISWKEEKIKEVNYLTPSFFNFL